MDLNKSTKEKDNLFFHDGIVQMSLHCQIMPKKAAVSVAMKFEILPQRIRL